MSVTIGVDDIARDELGYIVQRKDKNGLGEGDGGDTLHRMGTYIYGMMLKFRKSDNVNAFGAALGAGYLVFPGLRVAPGRYIRHPNREEWWSKPNETTRDQLIPWIIALGELSRVSQIYTNVFWELFRTLAKRGFFGFNTANSYIPDTFLFHASVLIRAATRSWLAWPLLCVTDVMLFLGSFLSTMSPLRWNDGSWRIERVSPDHTDDWNEVLTHIQAFGNNSTPFSYWARKWYFKHRPESYGLLAFNTRNPAWGALSWYNRTDAGGNPGLLSIYRDIIQDPVFCFGLNDRVA